MRNKVAYVLGFAGMAAIGFWMGLRRKGTAARNAAMAGLPMIDVDDDQAAELIARYRPALEAVVAGAPE
jgi:hypothetical protein